MQYARPHENAFTKLREKDLMDLAVVAAARKLFTKADSIRNKTLDRQELENVVRDLACANRHYLTPAQITAEVSKCIGNDSVLDEGSSFNAGAKTRASSH